MLEPCRPSLAANRRFGKFLAALALHFAMFLGLFVAWGAIAGQSGSPVPDNWPVLARMLDVIEVSMQATLFLVLLAPLAGWAAARRSRWYAVYPVLLFLDCVVTVGLCEIAPMREAPLPVFRVMQEYSLTHTPRGSVSAVPPHFVAPPHDRCWRFGQVIPAADAVGRPIRFGDLVRIRPATGSDGPLPDTPEQTAQRKAWVGHIVEVEGTMQGGALRYHPIGADAGREAPEFCLWPDNVEHVRMH